MFFHPILWPKCSIRIHTPVTGVITFVNRFDANIDGRGKNIVLEGQYLFWVRENLIVAIFVLLHIKSLYSTTIVLSPRSKQALAWS